MPHPGHAERPKEGDEMTASQPEGYLASPPSGKGRGVLVLHAWWGLNDATKGFCQRLADEGFVAFAPDLYHGMLADTIPDAEALAKATNSNYTRAWAEVGDATRYLGRIAGPGHGGLGVVGFSMGANYALDLAPAEPEQVRSVVLYYGTGGGDWSKSKAAYLGHFAETDPYEPREGVDELEESLKQAGRPVTFYHYPGTGHWFAEPNRIDAYNEPAANLAWDRTLAFLKNPRS
jgi:carboxymethylenebutenolidase